VLRRQQDTPASVVCHEPVETRDAVLHVVAVREESLRMSTTGAVVVLGLLALLATLHPDWTTVVGFVVVDVAGSVIGTARAIVKFRRRLEALEPLRGEAVEVTGRPRQRRPQSGWQIVSSLVVLAVIVAANAVYALDEGRTWIERFLAGMTGLLAAAMVVQPFVEGWLASRWERRHGHARLFRPVEFEDDADERQLYVATRPVPAA
jgi:hypothetical protein